MLTWHLKRIALGMLLWSLVGGASHAATAPASAYSVLLSPSLCYQRYLQVIEKAGRLQDLHSFLSAERIQALQKGLEAAQSVGADPLKIETATLKLLKRGASAPDRIREQRFEREASLLIERPGLTVEVRLVVEDGSWRIADERFRPAPRF